MSRLRFTAIPWLVGLLLLPAPSAQARPELIVEGTLGAAWRTALDATDRNPGFLAILGNADLSLALSWGGVALVGGARGRVGRAAGDLLSEFTGSIGLELALGERVRARLGADAGEILFRDLHAPLVGGYLAVGFQAATFASGHAAAVLTLRLDLDDIIGNDDRLPNLSTSLAAGVGLRY